MATKESHVGTRVSAVTAAQLDLIKDLRGLPSVAALLNDYITKGLRFDSVDIEGQIEERIATEAARLRGLVGQLQAPSEDDEGEEPDMFMEDEAALVAPGTKPTVTGPADNSDLVPD